MTSSTDISQDFEEVDDEYDDQVEQEQFDVGDEDIIDNDVDGAGGVEEEDEKQSGQEGLDLNMCEEMHTKMNLMIKMNVKVFNTKNSLMIKTTFVLGMNLEVIYKRGIQKGLSVKIMMEIGT